MKQVSNLSDFHALQFPLHVQEKDGKFYIYQPELKLLTEGDSVELAYRRYTEEKDKLFEKLSQLKLLHTIPLPAPNKNQDHLHSEIKLFFFKSFITVFTVGLFMIFSGPALTSWIRHEVRSLLPFHGKPLQDFALEIPKEMNVKLSNIGPDKLKEIQTEWHALGVNLKPLLSSVMEVLPAQSCQGRAAK